MRFNCKRKTKPDQSLTYNREEKSPVIKASICNGEQVAGLKDKKTGRFEELMVIRTNQDLEEFIEICGITADEIKKEY